jgi:hypothetical protein
LAKSLPSVQTACNLDGAQARLEREAQEGVVKMRSAVRVRPACGSGKCPS